jgi:hypothetical protein
MVRQNLLQPVSLAADFLLRAFSSGFQPLGFMNALPFRWIGLLYIAAASHYLIEKRAIRLGHRLTDNDVAFSPAETCGATNKMEGAGVNQSL